MTKNKWLKRVLFLSFRLVFISFGMSYDVSLALAQGGVIYPNREFPSPKQDTNNDKVTNIDIEKIYNNATASSWGQDYPLNDQVLNGKIANFRPSFKSWSLKAGETIVVKWSFVGESLTSNPISTQPTGWNVTVPPDQGHKLDEKVRLEIRRKGVLLDAHDSPMKVFFYLTDTSDTHFRADGNTDANWYRHWAANANNAVPNYSTSQDLSHCGYDKIKMNWQAVKGYIAGETNWQVNSTTDAITSMQITLFDRVTSASEVNWDSPGITITGSDGVARQFPAKTHSVHYKKGGIDHARKTMEHEFRHVEMVVKWAPDGEWRRKYGIRRTDDGDERLGALENDYDGDLLPNESEDVIGTWWGRQVTFNVAPLFPISYGHDDELWVESLVQGIPDGNDQNDWAWPGKQSTPKMPW